MVGGSYSPSRLTAAALPFAGVPLLDTSGPNVVHAAFPLSSG